MFIIWSRKKKGLIILAMILFIGIVSLTYTLFKSSSKISILPNPPAGEITIQGTMVCLPHRNIGGPQTLECAFGLKDNEGHYFALKDSDPSYNNISGVPTNISVEVKGIFTPKEDIKYQSIGVIYVTNISQLSNLNPD